MTDKNWMAVLDAQVHKPVRDCVVHEAYCDLSML